MQENDIVKMELKVCEDKINANMEKLTTASYELQELQLVINHLINVILNEKGKDISIIFDEIKEKLIFMGDELSYFENKIQNSEIKTIWELLRIVQDFYSDKETEKINYEEELKHLKMELENILDVLKESEKRKRL